MHFGGDLGLAAVPTRTRYQAIDPVVPIGVIPGSNGLGAEAGPAGAGNLIVALGQFLHKASKLSPMQGPVQRNRSNGTVLSGLAGEL